MDLIHNQAIKIVGGNHEGLYRILLDESTLNQTVLVRLDAPVVVGGQHKGGRKPLGKTKSPRKKPRPPNVGQPIWLDRELLKNLKLEGRLHIVEVEPENPGPRVESDKQKTLLERRLAGMEPFLSLTTFREQLLMHRGLGGLVRVAQEKSGFAKSVVYRLFSQLCRYGFSERSLRPEFDHCGAPGEPRPCDPEGRDKAGRKTQKQRLAIAQGIVLKPEQPGISTAWKSLILSADKSIPSPKPDMPQRVTHIIHSAFVTRYKVEGGNLFEVDPQLGSYPNREQIQRVLEQEIPRLQRLLEKTTSGYFKRNMRGIMEQLPQALGRGNSWRNDPIL